jgi:hypothetical protein
MRRFFTLNAQSILRQQAPARRALPTRLAWQIPLWSKAERGR